MSRNLINIPLFSSTISEGSFPISTSPKQSGQHTEMNLFNFPIDLDIQFHFACYFQDSFYLCKSEKQV